MNDVIFQFKNQVSENFRIAFVLNVINYSSSKIYVFGYKKLPVRTTLQKGITVSKNFLFFLVEFEVWSSQGLCVVTTGPVIGHHLVFSEAAAT